MAVVEIIQWKDLGKMQVSKSGKYLRSARPFVIRLFLRVTKKALIIIEGSHHSSLSWEETNEAFGYHVILQS